MQSVKLDTGFNIEVEFPITPFHKRLFAWLIDLAVMWLYTKLVATISGVGSFMFFVNEWNWKGVLITIPIFIYYPFCEILFNGQTAGKRAMNIRVIAETGGQPATSQYLIRWFFRLVDFPFWIPLYIVLKQLPVWTLPITFGGLICVILTPRSQRIGDLLAGTILIDLKNRTSWEDTVFKQIEDNYQPRYPQVMQLSDRDINTLKSIIETSRKKGDTDLSMKIADRIQSKLKMTTDQTSLEFLETLLKDYNYYATN